MKSKFPAEIRGKEVTAKTHLIFHSDHDWGQSRVSTRLEARGSVDFFFSLLSFVFL